MAVKKIKPASSPAIPTGDEKSSGATVTPQRGRASSRTREAEFPVVGLGASAGGLDAFERFFRNLPPNSGMPFIIVQHLDPGHRSLLGELLQRFTQIPVVEITDRQVVRPDHIYVIPPNRDLAIEGGALRLQERPADSTLPRLPIDHFFRSLAADQAARAIGIVLSGTGSEGALGLKEIKGAGGLTLVQEPASAQFDGMPRHAIATGFADLILPPEKMPAALLNYVRRNGLHTGWRIAPGAARTNPQMQRILELLRTHTGHDFSLYKMNTIVRRIERRMSIQGIDDMAVYVQQLEGHSADVMLLFKDLLIEVTSFYRDPAAWELIAQKIIPELLAARPLDQPLRVWVPGCATGEEAYTIAMLLRDQLDSARLDHRVQIFATDIDREAIDRARSGHYPETIAADLPGEMLVRHFVRENGGYRVKKSLRDLVIFAEQSVIKDPPFSRLDLISCRNLMIYLDTALQQRLLKLFHYALVPGGFLHLGSAETVGAATELFQTLDRKWKLYRSNPAQPRVRSPLPIPSMPQLPPAPPALPGTLPRPRGGLRDRLEQALLAAYAPPAVIVSAGGDVLALAANTGRVLAFGEADGSPQLTSLAPPELREEVMRTLGQAAASDAPVRTDRLPLHIDGVPVWMHVAIRPLADGSDTHGLYLVTFEEEVPVDSARVDTAPRSSALEQELQRTRENLQATVEELATANADLRASNDELQSSNEELQSTNEELETSKEELQSVNEELTTVNTELEMNLDQLAKANSDLNNLLANTEIGTLFLNHELRIQRFTPATVRFVNLIPHDVGRPLAHVVSNLYYPDLVMDARLVLETLAPRTCEVRTVSDEWCLVRLLPYRTVDNTIDGVVITFTDITQQRRSEDHALMMRWAVEQAPSIVMITDTDWKIDYVNPSFTALTGYGADEVRGQIPDFLHADRHDADFLKRLQATLHAGREWRGDVCERIKSGDAVWLKTTITPVKDRAGVVIHYLVLQEDRTEARSVVLLRRMAAVMQDADEAITVQDFDGRILAWNHAAEQLFGWSENEALGMNVRDYTPPERHAEPADVARRLRAGGAVTTFRTERLHKDGRRLAVWLTVKRLLDDNGQPAALTTSERLIPAPVTGETTS